MFGALGPSYDTPADGVPLGIRRSELKKKQVCAAEMAVRYTALCASRKVHTWRRRRRRRSGIAGAGLSLYARLISHFNKTNMVFNYI